MDDEWARIAREDLPGFAGFYAEPGEEDITLVLKDTTRGADKRARTEAHLRLGTRGQARHVKRVQAARYDYNELQQWRIAVRGIDDPGLMSLYIDPRQNRIVIGVGTGRDRGHIERELRRFGIPVDAVMYVREVPRCSRATPRPPVVTGGPPARRPRRSRRRLGRRSSTRAAARPLA